MSEHDRVLTGVVESFGSGEEGYQDVTDDDFSKEHDKDPHESLRGMLHSMIGERVLITIDKYPTANGLDPMVTTEFVSRYPSTAAARIRGLMNYVRNLETERDALEHPDALHRIADALEKLVEVEQGRPGKRPDYYDRRYEED